MKHYLFFLAGGLALGCASQPPPTAAPAAPTSSGKSDPSKAASAAASEKTMAAAARTMLENFQRVHFDFDSFKLSEGSKAALQANAEIMIRHADLQVEVQGHADDRGTSEYNLALGEKRAQAVQAYLTAFGVRQDRVGVISFGEEKPLARGQGESTWSKNRRAEFRVVTGADEASGTTD